MSNFIDAAFAVRFLKRLMTPFDKWKAYSLGVIDSSGNILIPKEKRTAAQANSLGYLDTIVINLRKILMKIPGGDSKLFKFAGVMTMMREGIDVEYDTDNPDDFITKLMAVVDEICSSDELIENMNSTYREIIAEDVPTNNISSGNIAAPQKSMPWRKNFAGKTVFSIDSARYHKARLGKNRYHTWDRYVGDDEIGEDIRKFAKENSEEDVIVQDESTSAMMYLRKKSK